VEVGQALELAAMRAGGVLGRYGGEEFIAFCHVVSEDALEHFSEAMRLAVEELQLPHVKRLDGYGIVTVSIGATMTRENTNPELDLSELRNTRTLRRKA
jgi:GGDEF domain-containing protein